MAHTVAAPKGSEASAHGNGEVHPKAGFWALTLGSLGVVYGDIGTSPLYALREAVVAAGGPGGVATESAVLGVLSLIIWALLLVVTAKYVLILLRLDNNGEGGTLALMALAQRAMGPAGVVVLLLGVSSAALFYGDAIITPAISVLSVCSAPHDGHPDRSVSGAISRHRPGRGVFRADHGGVVRGDRHRGSRASRCEPQRVARSQSDLWADVFGRPRDHRSGRAGRRVPGRDRSGSALRRSGAFRQETDPDGLDRIGASRAGDQLSRAGCAGARGRKGTRESVLPALPGLGAIADGPACDRRDGDCQPGGDHGGLFADPAGDRSRSAAPARGSSHFRSARRADLHAARERAVVDRGAAPGCHVPLIERARLRIWNRGDRHHGGRRDHGFHRDLETLALVAGGCRRLDVAVPGDQPHLLCRQSAEDLRGWLGAPGFCQSGHDAHVYMAARHPAAVREDPPPGDVARQSRCHARAQAAPDRARDRGIPDQRSPERADRAAP